MIASQYQIAVMAPEGRVVRRMASAKPDVPVSPADAYRVAVINPAKPQRHRMHNVGKVKWAFRKALIQYFRVYSSRFPEI